MRSKDKSGNRADDRDTEEYINRLLAAGFISRNCKFPTSRNKKTESIRSLIQAMLLLDSRYTQEVKIEEALEESFKSYYRRVIGNYSDKQKNILESAIEYLTEAFKDSEKIVYSFEMPILIYLADMAEDIGLEPLRFKKWWKEIIKED